MRSSAGSGADSAGLNPAVPTYWLSFPNCKMGITYVCLTKVLGEFDEETQGKCPQYAGRCLCYNIINQDVTYSFIQACVHSLTQ